MRVYYLVAALLVIGAFPSYGQTEVPTTDAKVPNHRNSAGPSAGAECNEAHDGVGDFAGQYPWYVRMVQGRIRQKWIDSEVDPHLQSATRVCLTFDISRSGKPSNIRIAQSSGVPLFDESALRAVIRVSSFGPLPHGYERDKASVLFWFDYKPARTAQ